MRLETYPKTLDDSVTVLFNRRVKAGAPIRSYDVIGNSTDQL